MRHTLTLLQIRILIAIIVKMQGFIRQQINGPRRQSSHIYPSDQLYKDHVAIQLPLALIMGVQKNYAACRKAMMKMCDTYVYIPKNDGSGWITAVGLFDVSFPKEAVEGQAMIYIHHIVFEHIFNVSKGFFRFSRAAFLSCRKRSTQMMYLFCEQWRNHGMVHLSMNTVVNMLGAASTYRRFSSFRRKQLDMAEQELKALYRERRTTCYFSYHPNYQGSNLRGEPSTITFHIHVVHSAADAQYSEEQIQHVVATLLSRHFNLYPSQVTKLSAQIDKWNYRDVIEKLHELQCRLRKNKNIHDTRAYAYAVISRFLDANTPTKNSQPTDEKQLSLSA